MLYIGCALSFLIGVVHSYLGEKYILIRLFKREDLPKLFGSDWITKRILRVGWHITTIAWWGFAGILFVLAAPGESTSRVILLIIAAVFLVSGIMSGGFSRGKHISWVVFWSISGLTLYAAIYNS